MRASKGQDWYEQRIERDNDEGNSNNNHNNDEDQQYYNNHENTKTRISTRPTKANSSVSCVETKRMINDVRAMSNVNHDADIGNGALFKIYSH